MSQPAQYDAITTTYSSLYGESSNSTYPCAVIEESNLKHVVSPFLQEGKPKRVLDLACGSGYYSRLLLKWGAASVVGVDISQSMLEEARRIQKTQSTAAGGSHDGDRLRYLVGDATSATLASELSSYGAPFDVVTGTWLLNYSRDPATLATMFGTIASVLAPAGVFVGLTIPPPPSGTAADEVSRSLRAVDIYGQTGHVVRSLPDDVGFEVHVRLGMPDTPVDRWVQFDNYYLRDWAFEQAAKEGGLRGGLEWQPFVITDEARQGKPRGYWNRILMNPTFRICLGWKE